MALTGKQSCVDYTEFCSTYTVSNDKMVCSACVANYRLDGTACVKCPDNCTKCTKAKVGDADVITCDTCAEGFAYLYLGDGSVDK